MYATKPIDGIPVIERNGEIVLSVCDQNWDFANWLCALLNQLGRMQTVFLNEQDMEGAFGKQVQNA
jgi:hypothetical protein